MSIWSVGVVCEGRNVPAVSKHTKGLRGILSVFCKIPTILEIVAHFYYWLVSLTDVGESALVLGLFGTVDVSSLTGRNSFFCGDMRPPVGDHTGDMSCSAASFSLSFCFKYCCSSCILCCSCSCVFPPPPGDHIAETHAIIHSNYVTREK